ncbi:MAG: DUF885 domain-containing protein [Legionella sp.]|nr:MAG: DUF885 domain-containing protein [Legionella sp.]
MAKSNHPSRQNQRERFIALAHDYEKAYFENFPEMGVFWGKKDVAYDYFRDHSHVATLRWQQREDEFLSALAQIDVKALQDTPEYITYNLLKGTLENNQGARVCHESLWHINPTFAGWHMISTRIAEKQPVGTPENRQMAIKRWNTFSKTVDDEINNLKLGISKGYTAPKTAVRIVLKQLQIILKNSPETSPYFTMAERDTDPQFKATITELIKNQIHPALQRYANFLENDYMPYARDQVGVSALPDGVACYQAKVKQETTLNMDPQKIHEFGLQHMEQLKSEVATIGMDEFGLEDMSAIFQEAKTRPEYLFKSEAEILSYNYAAFERAKSKMSAWFGIIPKSEAIIKPYPEYRAKTGASGEYSPPSEDGTQPGTYYINTYNPTAKSRVDQEAILFHELIPGHHLQVAISYEDKSHHSLDKYLWNAGFGEGWALYAERVADEMNLYTDEISRLGMLANETLRTARLVVDPGLHVMNWTREEAIEYMKQHTAMSDFIIEGEVDRYIMLPGQATSYMLGKQQIDLLRHLAEKKMGNHFDIREFHAQVLKNGAVTLPMLQEQINHWIESKLEK